MRHGVTQLTALICDVTANYQHYALKVLWPTGQSADILRKNSLDIKTGDCGGPPMPNRSNHLIANSPAFRYLVEKQEALLGLKTEELAGIQFSILLTARWEAAERTDSELRAELRNDLVNLRVSYFDKIDEIAMTCGVQAAMDAKKSVERMVMLPSENAREATPTEEKQYS
jgi:hypothetical protein